MIQESRELDIYKNLESAQEEGLLSDESIAVLQKINRDRLALPAAQSEILKFQGNSIFLATLNIDDSSSMSGFEEVVRTGQKAVVEALKELDESSSTWLQTWFLNVGEVFPFTPVQAAQLLDSQTYHPSRGGYTPLFSRSAELLLKVLALAQDHRNRYGNVTTGTMIITDGEDNDSGNITALDVKKIITDMEQTREHLILGMAIEDEVIDTQTGEILKGPATLALEAMGINSKWILNPGSKLEEIRAAFRKGATTLKLASKPETLVLLLESGKGFEGVENGK